jgi:hypothetical protein
MGQKRAPLGLNQGYMGKKHHGKLRDFLKVCHSICTKPKEIVRLRAAKFIFNTIFLKIKTCFSSSVEKFLELLVPYLKILTKCS